MNSLKNEDGFGVVIGIAIVALIVIIIVITVAHDYSDSGEYNGDAICDDEKIICENNCYPGPDQNRCMTDCAHAYESCKALASEQFDQSALSQESGFDQVTDKWRKIRNCNYGHNQCYNKCAQISLPERDENGQVDTNALYDALAEGNNCRNTCDKALSKCLDGAAN